MPSGVCDRRIGDDAARRPQSSDYGSSTTSPLTVIGPIASRRYHGVLQGSTMAPVRVRIAPSPTGDPHVGTAYIALFNYVVREAAAAASSSSGSRTPIRRRARGDSEQMIYDALHWVGLSWDEGPDVGGPHAPYRQSERATIYREHAQILLANGARLSLLLHRGSAREAARPAAGREADARLRPSLPRDRAERERHARRDGETFVVRLAVPLDGTITWKDELREGEQSARRQRHRRSGAAQVATACRRITSRTSSTIT